MNPQIFFKWSPFYLDICSVVKFCVENMSNICGHFSKTWNVIFPKSFIDFSKFYCTFVKLDFKKIIKYFFLEKMEGKWSHFWTKNVHSALIILKLFTLCSNFFWKVVVLFLLYLYAAWAIFSPNYRSFLCVKKFWTKMYRIGAEYIQKHSMGSSGIWTRDLSHPKRESYP